MFILKLDFSVFRMTRSQNQVNNEIHVYQLEEENAESDIVNRTLTI